MAAVVAARAGAIPRDGGRAVTGMTPPGDLAARQGTLPLPATTLLYQNFPNPFPTPISPTTCVWFDLAQASQVNLTIHDIRGHLVRRIVPSSAITNNAFPAGRYGRIDAGSTVGCDGRFSWDGRDDRGSFVPTGVYLLRLKTDTYEGVKRILFRGR
jgi:hypothetical protein